MLSGPGRRRRIVPSARRCMTRTRPRGIWPRCRRADEALADRAEQAAARAVRAGRPPGPRPWPKRRPGSPQIRTA